MLAVPPAASSGSRRLCEGNGRTSRIETGRERSGRDAAAFTKADHVVTWRSRAGKRGLSMLVVALVAEAVG